jgi:flagellar motor switch protein FliN/FliY
MPLSVQLGQVSLLVRDLLRLGPGSVVALDRKVGEPVDVFLRDTKLATGQLVVVGDQLGVRIKEILSQDRQQVADMGEA